VFAPVQRKKRWRVKQKVSEDEIILGHAKRGDWGLYSLTFVALPESDGKVSIAAVGGDMRIETFFTRHIPKADATAYMKRNESMYRWSVAR